MKKLLKEIVLKNKISIVCGLIINVLISIVSVLIGVSLNLTLDSALGINEIPLYIALGIGLSVFIAQPILNGIYAYLKSKITEKTSNDLRKQTLEHIQQIPLITVDRYHSGDLLTRLTSDMDKLATILPGSILELIKGGLTVILALIYGISLNIEMTLVVIIIFPILIIWGKYTMPLLQKMYLTRQEKEAQLRIFFQDQLQDIAISKSYTLLKANTIKFNKINKEKIDIVLKSDVMNQVAWGGSDAIGSLAFFASVGIGCFFITQGKMTVGEVMGFSQILNFLIWPFTEMMGIIAELQSKIASTNRLREIWDIEKEDTCEEKMDNSIQQEVQVVVDNVSFGYENQQEVLSNINIKFNKKGINGIIGSSGCGKTTLIKLLLGLYSPKAGNIYILDGNDVIKGSRIRNYISYVPQNKFLITGTIKENILNGNQEATLTEVEEAAKKAHIHDIIKALPNGYDTMLGENGIGLSVGQAQRVAIARAIIKNSPVLIFDEPTSALDPKSERDILETISELSKEYLCIMVAHGDTAYSYCEQLIIIENGTLRIANNIEKSL